MFGKIQTLSNTLHETRSLSRVLAASVCLLTATASHASLSAGNELKLAKATADDLACHTLAIELKSARLRGDFNFFPNVEQGCVRRILTHQPQLLRGASLRSSVQGSVSGDKRGRYSYNR